MTVKNGTRKEGPQITVPLDLLYTKRHRPRYFVKPFKTDLQIAESLIPAALKRLDRGR
jgi:hypothetical protein